MAQGNYGSVDVNPRGKLGESAKIRKRRNKKLSRSVRLLDSATSVRGHKKREPSVSPAKRAGERLTEKKTGEPLSRSLSRIAAGAPPGRTTIGKAFSTGLSGAALGSLIGESIAKARRTRAKRARQDEEFAMERLGSAALDLEEARDRKKERKT